MSESAGVQGTTDLTRPGLIAIAAMLIIWLPLFLLKIEWAPLFLGLALLIFEGLILGWLHGNGHMSGVVALVVLFLVDGALVVFWASFQLDLYHPIYDSVPPSMCDTFIIANGGPEDFASGPGLCTEEFLQSVIEYNFPVFGDGRNWPGIIMTAVNDDFRRDDTELPRYKRAVEDYS